VRGSRSFTLARALALPAGPDRHRPRLPMTRKERIDYIELASADLERAKSFYADAFGWTFKDYGETYTYFELGEVNGGITTDREVVGAGKGSLVVLHSSDLDGARGRVEAAGGKIVVETFEFPGGRRFQFTDPDGNEIAVWTEPAS